MTKTKPKKPTLNEVRQVMDNLIHDLTIVNNKVDTVSLILNDYVLFKDDVDGYTKFLKDRKEKADAKQGTVDESSK
tara:strand:+ start:307 stop:534 length:228 start_codon:yes stop_codon:yes gene_type:complete